MSRDAEEYYKRENQKARKEAFDRNLEIIGKGISGVANFFAERKAKKEQKRIEEAGERLATELGIEDTGTLYPEFETNLYKTVACLVTFLAKKNNRFDSSSHQKIVNVICRLSLTYVGSEPMVQLSPIMTSDDAATDTSPEGKKRISYWTSLESVAQKEVTSVLAKGDKLDLEKLVNEKAKEVGEFGQNPVWLTSLYYGCVAFLVYPEGVVTVKGQLLLGKISELIGLDDEAIEEIQTHAEENADLIRDQIEPKEMREGEEYV